MQTLKNILIATDFSKCGSNALVYAINLAQQINAKLYVLHVQDIKDGDNKLSKEQIENEINAIKHDYLFLRNLETRFLVKEGIIKDIIIEEANSNHIDLIIIGIKGASGIRESKFGSITAKLMDHTPCAIIGVPDNCQTLAFNKILVSVDYNYELSPPELYVVSFIAEAFSADVDILHIQDKGSSNKPESTKIIEKLKDLFKYNIIEHHNFTADNIGKSINDHAINNQIDLLTVFHIINEKGHAFKRSICKQLALSCQIPILIIPIEAS